jgi:hypothetical protein
MVVFAEADQLECLALHPKVVQAAGGGKSELDALVFQLFLGSWGDDAVTAILREDCGGE